MPGLILKLRAGEEVLINGVLLQNGDRGARLTIKTPDARVLRLRDAIHPAEADTPLKRICVRLQLAVAGHPKPAEVAALRTDIAALATEVGARATADAVTALDEGNAYAALRALRRLLPDEPSRPVQSSAVSGPGAASSSTGIA